MLQNPNKQKRRRVGGLLNHRSSNPNSRQSYKDSVPWHRVSPMSQQHAFHRDLQSGVSCKNLCEFLPEHPFRRFVSFPPSIRPFVVGTAVRRFIPFTPCNAISVMASRMGFGKQRRQSGSGVAPDAVRISSHHCSIFEAWVAYPARLSP